MADAEAKLASLAGMLSGEGLAGALLGKVAGVPDPGRTAVSVGTSSLRANAPDWMLSLSWPSEVGWPAQCNWVASLARYRLTRLMCLADRVAE